MSRRVFAVVLDSFGVGALPDAEAYGDAGSNTYLHILQSAAPDLKNLRALGLNNLPGIGGGVPRPCGRYGRLRELSRGKDTTTGHWELMGLTLRDPFPTFPNGFPQNLLDAFRAETGLSVLGNKTASGTAIIQELGDAHIKTGSPIVYTSADSVLQVAAHESIYPPEKLYELCRIFRRLCTGTLGVGRIIARPFIGSSGRYSRTENRRDFSLEPTGETVLDRLCARGLDVLGVGKIQDIFAGRSITESFASHNNDEGIRALLSLLDEDFRGLCFVNLVDFDSLYGHRRDPVGYASALERFDAALPEVFAKLRPDDLLLITADHGCDPCFKGTDHTREWVPLLLYGTKLSPLPLGDRLSLSVAGETVENWLKK